MSASGQSRRLIDVRGMSVLPPTPDVSLGRGDLAEQARSSDLPMKPQVVAYALNELLRNDCIITTDSGTNTSWAARFLHIRGDMQFSVSGNLASAACGLPYANAAAIAFPGRRSLRWSAMAG
jgi:pyruvate dehydrogenase (quinone)